MPSPAGRIAVASETEREPRATHRRKPELSEGLERISCGLPGNSVYDRTPAGGFQRIRPVAAIASPEPNAAPASTSLKKCIPKRMRETAMLTAQNNRP